MVSKRSLTLWQDNNRQNIRAIETYLCGECLLFDDLSIMYGYNPEDPKRQILNYYILLGKRHIFLQRSEIKPPSFDHFLEFVKDKLIVQRSIFYSKGQKAKFLSQWKPLLSLL